MLWLQRRRFVTRRAEKVTSGKRRVVGECAWRGTCPSDGLVAEELRKKPGEAEG